MIFTIILTNQSKVLSGKELYVKQLINIGRRRFCNWNLEYLNTETFNPGHLHPLLKINEYSPRDVVWLPSKLRLM